jgi:hypothetical protein
LRDVAREEPGFFAELLASLPPRELGRVFVRVLESEEVAAQVASLIARRIAVPLDVATRQDLRRFGEADGQAGEGAGRRQEPRGEA